MGEAIFPRFHNLQHSPASGQNTPMSRDYIVVSSNTIAQYCGRYRFMSLYFVGLSNIRSIRHCVNTPDFIKCRQFKNKHIVLNKVIYIGIPRKKNNEVTTKLNQWQKLKTINSFLLNLMNEIIATMNNKPLAKYHIQCL